MPINVPDHQITDGFPTSTGYTPGGPHNAALVAAHKTWSDHLAQDDWEDVGVKEGVTLARKPNPSDPNGVPIVKGVATVPNATTDQVLGAIFPTGTRRLWDARLDSAAVLHREDPLAYEFYSLMKGQMFISPRDFVGVQSVERSHESNKTITMTQVSIVDDDLAPEQSGRVRGKIHFAGWLIEPVGSDVQLTYICCVSLEGSIPVVLVRQVSTEIPLCTGRVRDVFAKQGWAPIFDVPPPNSAIAVGVDDEHADLTVGKYTAVLRAIAPGTAVLRYDTKTAFSKGVQLATTVQEGAADGIVITDDGAGAIKIEVKEVGALVELVVTRK